MAQLAGANLSKVDVFASSVLDAPLSDTWAEARNFGQSSFWERAGQGEFRVKRVSTKAVAEIGCERLFTIGHARLFEELSGLDDLEHIVRWILVSHPHTLSPFGQASFLNYTSSLQLRAVTVSDQTYAEWRGSFYTEPHYAAQMEGVLQSWYFAGFKGLEATSQIKQPPEIPAPTMPFAPTALNSNYSIPVQPPSVDQLAFHSSEVRPMSNMPSNIGVNSGMGMAEHYHTGSQGGPSYMNGHHSQTDLTSDRYSQGPASTQQTHQSRQMQQARAAFGQNTSSRGGSGKSMPSGPTSPSAINRIPQQPMSMRPGPSSNASSGESIDQGGRVRRTAEYDQPQGGNGYHSNLGSIEENMQRSEILDPTFQGGNRLGPESLSRNVQDLSLGIQASSSLSSNGSQPGYRQQIGQQPMGHSLDGNSKYQTRRTTQTPARRSWQGDEISPKRPGSASAMKAEAMQAFQVPSNKLSREQRSRASKSKQLRPDWEAMKETVYVNDEEDAKLMADVAENVGNQCKENSGRSSLEKEVAQLQERHQKLHGRKSTSDQPYVSPFSASPFAAAGPTEGSAPQTASPFNPFAAAQPTLGSPHSSNI